MSTLALPLGAGKAKLAAWPRVAVHPLLSPKRLLQFGLVACVVLPIPNDDGPIKPHTPVLAQIKQAALGR